MNLDRLNVLNKYKNLNHDLNQDEFRKVQNPDSFKYDSYFDGYGQNHTLSGQGLSPLKYKNHMEKENYQEDRFLK